MRYKCGLAECWDSWTETEEFYRLVKRVADKDVTMMDIMAVFAAGMRYEELAAKRVKK